MTHGTILAHHILVLEHNTCPRTVVLGEIGPADEVDDLTGFDRTGAGVHGIGPDAGEIVYLEPRDRPAWSDTAFSLAAMIARVDVGIEAFDPISDELDGSSQQL